jgi:PAS domain S-box-containing protein
MVEITRFLVWRSSMVMLGAGIVLGLIVLLQQSLPLTTYPLFYAVVAVSAYLGGVRVGLLASLAASFVISMLLNGSAEQGGRFNWIDLLRLSVFVLLTFLLNLNRVKSEIKTAQLYRNLQLVQQQKNESLALLNAFLASAPVGFAFLNCDRRYVLINDALATAHHLSIPDHTGKTVWDTLTPALAELVENQLKQVLETRCAIVNQEASDQGRDWLSTYFPVCAETGELLGVGATVLDVTERKKNQNALREALQKLNSHVENTPLAVVEWDREYRLIRWSRQAEVLFGWAAEEVLGKRPQDWNFVVPQDYADVQAAIERLVTGVERRNIGQNRNYRNDGTIIVCEWYSSALFDESGQFESVLCLVLDVTQRVQLEAEQQRILRLEQAARADAELANRLKDEFLAVLSHELRSPLNPILGWSKLLQTGRLSPERSQEALATIERNAKLQSQLIEDLLDVSRILRGKLVLNLFPVNLEFIISAALETVRLTADSKAIQIKTILASTSGQVLGDSARLQQVVWNLLSNAVKFTPERGRIHVRLDRVGSDAQIQVIDSGKGIKSEFLPYVFEYFRQEDGSTTRNFGGLGLGLALVRHIVEQHQGRVWADSAGEGQGATFTVRLPLLPTENQLPDRPIQTQLMELEAEPLTGLKILAIDNDPAMLTFVGVALRQAGAQVIEANSAIAALETLQHYQPDLIISDIGMPECDGYTLLRYIRSPDCDGLSGLVPSFQAIPETVHHTPAGASLLPKAIALTAYAGEDNRQQAIESGFQKHLAKPVDPEQLIAAIVELCSDSKIHTSNTID